MKVQKDKLGFLFINIPKDFIDVFRITHEDKLVFILSSNKYLNEFDNYEKTFYLNLEVIRSKVRSSRIRVSTRISVPKNIVKLLDLNVGDDLNVAVVSGTANTPVEFTLIRRGHVGSVNPIPKESQKPSLENIESLDVDKTSEEIPEIKTITEEEEKYVKPVFDPAKSMFVPSKPATPIKVLRPEKRWINDPKRGRRLVEVVS